MHVKVKVKLQESFKSWRSYWEFSHAVRSKYRYWRNPQQEAFLRVVSETAKKKVFIVTPDMELWRARLGNDVRTWKEGTEIFEEDIPRKPEEMVPQKNSRCEGRVNAKGIPCLYLAADRNTALAEVRPWLGVLISIGEFRAVKELRLVNCLCRGYRLRYIYRKEPNRQKREKAVWDAISRAFSSPVSPSDGVADYAPTQIIAEQFKADGFDGIIYRSLLTGEPNIALFNLDSVELHSQTLYKAINLTFEFEQAGNIRPVRRKG